MTAPTPVTYEELELESSNLLMERDGLLVRGRRADSAEKSRQAGEMRRRMGEMRRAAGRPAEALEDWLSAAECFLDAGEAVRAGEVITELQPLAGSSEIRKSRPDLIEDAERRVRRWRQLQSGSLSAG